MKILPWPTHLRSASVLLFAGLALANAPTGQIAAPPSMTAPLSNDSGWVSNTGSQPTTIAAFHVFEQDTPWMRLFFSEVVLSGNVAAGTGSVLRITSLLDGYFQLLNAQTILEWEKSSAYFNGDVLLLEIIAHPGTGQNRVALDHAVFGFSPAGEDTICGSDDRVLSNDPRAARLLPIGCTGFLIDDNCGCFLTAGHCTTGSSVAQFNVPLSNANGSLNNPPPADQYSVDTSSRQFTNGGVGNDWGYFGTFANSTTGLTAKQAQGSVYTFVSPPPPWNNSLQVRITGYGVDGGTRNQVQQTNAGPWVQYNGGNQLQYQTDTQGGSSGSPVIQEQASVTMGIHTHGGCGATSGANSGTASAHPNLINALANPKGVCDKPAPPTCTVAAVVQVRNGTGVNPLCLTNVTQPIVGTAWQFEVDAAAIPGGQISIVRAQAAIAGSFNALGELLINLSSPALFTSARSGPSPHLHSINVPNNVELAGFSSSLQAAIGVTPDVSQLCNALDFTVGCE